MAKSVISIVQCLRRNINASLAGIVLGGARNGLRWPLGRRLRRRVDCSQTARESKTLPQQRGKTLPQNPGSRYRRRRCLCVGVARSTLDVVARCSDAHPRLRSDCCFEADTARLCRAILFWLVERVLVNTNRLADSNLVHRGQRSYHFCICSADDVGPPSGQRYCLGHLACNEDDSFTQADDQE